MRTLSLLSFCCFFLMSTALHAASNYTQNFSGSALGWAKSDPSQTWTVTAGNFYENRDAATVVPVPAKVISYYNNDTWNTNYTYSLRMMGDWGASGNVVGAVFNYQDVNNFYEVSFGSLAKNSPTDQATVTLYNVASNVRTAVASATFPAPGVDTWFTVKIIRRGDRTTIDVDGVARLTRVQHTGQPAGKIGVIGRFNNVAFDDVRVSIATYLFSSGFGPSVTQGTWSCAGVWIQTLLGSDAATGFTWPPNFWGEPLVGMFNTTIPCPEQQHANYVQLDLPGVTGPTGTTSTALMNNVLVFDDSTWPPEHQSGGARLGASYRWGVGAGPGYYIRRWLKYPANLMQQMPNNGFFNQHEYKSIDCTGSPGRLTIQWKKNTTWGNHYRVVRDTNNDCPGTTTVIWQRFCSPTFAIPPSQGGGNCPATVPNLPLGQWFYDEFYVHHSLQNHNPQDRVAYAVNGQVVFDINLSTIPEPSASNPPRGMKLTPGYLNVENMPLLIDDLEVLDQIPCATFPCGPPTHY
jgi:hypothetical protein